MIGSRTYLLEKLDYQERCFRDYVKSIREEYDIKKPEKSRQYEAAVSCHQKAQLGRYDETNKTVGGWHKKVYCFGMVMTHSVTSILWQEKPFTRTPLKAAY
ncbi:hypothetical protein MASR2M70_17860 [Bacillota bacterium]